LIDLLEDKLINLITAQKILKELIIDSNKLPKEVKLTFLIRNMQYLQLEEFLTYIRLLLFIICRSLKRTIGS